MPFRRSPKLSYSPTVGEIFQLIGYRPWCQPTRSIEAVKGGDVVRGHQAALVVGDTFEVARDHFERIGPGGIRMREIRSPHQTFDADKVPHHDADAIVLKSCRNLAPEIVTRRIRNRLYFQVAILLKRMVQA